MSELLGLEAYNPAPAEVPAPPAWVVMSGDLWARIDGICQPVLVEDATGGGLEISTCERGLRTCGVSVAATSLLTTSHAWCREERDEVTQPWSGRVLKLVAVEDETAIWRQVVQLSVVPVGFRVESQQCTGSSLRAYEKHLKQLEKAVAANQKDSEGLTIPLSEVLEPSKEKKEPLPEWTGAVPVYGNRVCVQVDAFQVQEGAESRFSFQMEEVQVPNVPGEADCRMPCPVDQLGDFGKATAQVQGKWFHPPGATAIALYRTGAACQESTFVEPSGVPVNLCTTLGAKLPE